MQKRDGLKYCIWVRNILDIFSKYHLLYLHEYLCNINQHVDTRLYKHHTSTLLYVNGRAENILSYISNLLIYMFTLIFLKIWK